MSTWWHCELTNGIKPPAAIHFEPQVPPGTWAQIHHTQEMRLPFKFTLNSVSYGTTVLVLSGVKEGLGDPSPSDALDLGQVLSPGPLGGPRWGSCVVVWLYPSYDRW